VMVTHDAREIPPEISRVVLLRKGKILVDGPKKAVMSSELLGKCYGLDVRVRWSGGFCDVHGV
jgi:iron complex transport system ATP-binding protein